MGKEAWNRERTRGIVQDIVNAAAIQDKSAEKRTFSKAVSETCKKGQAALKAAVLFVSYRANKDFVPNLLRYGLLSELAQRKPEEKTKIINGLMGSSYVVEIMKGYGLDAGTLAKLLVVLSDSQAADEIGKTIADLIENKKPQQNTTILTKLFNHIIDASSKSRSLHITSASMISDFLSTVCSHKLPENYKLVVALDNKINNVQTSAVDRELCVQQRDELTKNFTVMDSLSYNIRDYVRIIEELNQLEFIATLIDRDHSHVSCMKKLNEAFMQYNDNPEATEKFQDLALAAVNLVTQDKLLKSLVSIVSEDLVRDVFKIIGGEEPVQAAEISAEAVEAVAETIGEVASDSRIAVKIGKKNTRAVKSLVNTISSPAVKEQKAVANTADSFASKMALKLVANLKDKEEILSKAIKDNKEDLADAIDVAITYAGKQEILEKCELTGKNIVDILPSLCTKSGMDCLAKCIEKPTATNIASLLLTDSKLLKFAVGTAVTFCKNVIAERLSSVGQVVNIEKLTEKVNKMLPKGFQSKTTVPKSKVSTQQSTTTHSL